MILYSIFFCAKVEMERVKKMLRVIFFVMYLSECLCIWCRKMRFRQISPSVFISIISTSKCLPPNLLLLHTLVFYYLFITWCITLSKVLSIKLKIFGFFLHFSFYNHHKYGTIRSTSNIIMIFQVLIIFLQIFKDINKKMLFGQWNYFY